MKALQMREPEALAAAEVSSNDRQPKRVDAIAHQAEHRGEQRERRDDRDGADDHCTGREAAKHVRPHDEEPEQRDDEGAAAEEDGAACRRPRALDRGLLVETASALLAKARDDEQRVVDPEREAHRRHHVDDEDRKRELPREQCRDTETDDDREDPEQYRHQAGDDRAEHEHQHDERNRQPEPELTMCEVLRRLGGEVVPDRVITGDRRGEATLPLAA